MFRKIGRMSFMLAFYSLGLAYGLSTQATDIEDTLTTLPAISPHSVPERG